MCVFFFSVEGCFWSEQRESRGAGPKRDRAASAQRLIHVANGLLEDAVEPQGRCDKRQIRGKTTTSYLSSVLNSSVAKID